MVYRVRTYEIMPEKLNDFNHFFHEFLLPNQLHFGSKLLGRWINQESTKITAIWEYRDIEQYYHIEDQIKKTDLHKTAQTVKKSLEPLFISTKQEFWTMTGEYSLLGGRQ